MRRFTHTHTNRPYLSAQYVLDHYVYEILCKYKSASDIEKDKMKLGSEQDRVILCDVMGTRASC